MRVSLPNKYRYGDKIFISNIIEIIISFSITSLTIFLLFPGSWFELARLFSENSRMEPLSRTFETRWSFEKSRGELFRCSKKRIRNIIKESSSRYYLTNPLQFAPFRGVGMGKNMDKRSKIWIEKKLRNFFSRFRSKKKKKRKIDATLWRKFLAAQNYVLQWGDWNHGIGKYDKM